MRGSSHHSARDKVPSATEIACLALRDRGSNRPSARTYSVQPRANLTTPTRPFAWSGRLHQDDRAAVSIPADSRRWRAASTTALSNRLACRRTIATPVSSGMPRSMSMSKPFVRHWPSPSTFRLRLRELLFVGFGPASLSYRAPPSAHARTRGSFARGHVRQSRALPSVRSQCAGGTQPLQLPCSPASWHC